MCIEVALLISAVFVVAWIWAAAKEPLFAVWGLVLALVLGLTTIPQGAVGAVMAAFGC